MTLHSFTFGYLRKPKENSKDCAFSVDRTPAYWGNDLVYVRKSCKLDCLFEEIVCIVVGDESLPKTSSFDVVCYFCRLPFSFVTDEVVQATCQCLLEQAVEAESVCSFYFRIFSLC